MSWGTKSRERWHRSEGEGALDIVVGSQAVTVTTGGETMAVVQGKQAQHEVASFSVKGGVMFRRHGVEEASPSVDGPRAIR